MNTRLDFRILGPLEVFADGAPLTIAGPRQRAVLSMLLTSPDRVVSVEALAEAVWDGQPPATGRTQVAICVAGLRKSFRAAGCTEPVVTTSSPGYRLTLARHRFDAHDFQALVAEARDAVRRGRHRQAVRLFSYALARWRGPALADSGSARIRAAAAAWDEERLAAYDQHVALRLELGEHQSLIGELTEAVRQEPLREQTRTYLMLAYHRCGRRAEALEVFREGRRHAVAELGLEPGAMLREVHGAILRDDGRPLPVPGLPAATATGGGPGGLPTGRSGPAPPDRELAELDQLLDERLEHSYRTLPPEAATLYRRLTLVGPAGAGAGIGAALLDTCPAEAGYLLQRLLAAQLADLAGRDPDGDPLVRLSGMRLLYAQLRAQLEEPPAAMRAAAARLTAAGLCLPGGVTVDAGQWSGLPRSRLPEGVGRLLTRR